MGRTSSAVKDRWNQKAYDTITLRVAKGEKARIKEAADKAGISVNSFINAAISDKIAKQT